ncbi:MAG: hypothetical protein CL920_20490 [Deltaproteobacteria bacterium]|nr:hypothetical protein [Deltaproteobacteria bacterium]
MFCHCVGIIQQDVPKQKRNFLKRDITRIFMCKRSDAGRNRTPSDGLWLIEQPGVFTPDPTMLTHRLCCALRALGKAARAMQKEGTGPPQTGFAR